MSGYNALVLARAEGGVAATWRPVGEDALGDGDVTIRVTHSTINYKDGLALTGRLPGVRLPLIPGVDFAGTVTASSHAEFAPGDDVILNGWGCGERRPGGYAERARVPGEWLIKRPATFTNAETMAIGTAGYTAMLNDPRARGSSRHAAKRSRSRHRCRGWRRQHCRRAAGKARLSRHRLDWPCAGG